MPEFLTSRAEKRKSQDEVTKDSEMSEDNKNTSDSQGLFNPKESLSVEIPAKKGKTATITMAAVSPVLLECPEQDCGKKYKHANGLKYHQSHAHGGGSIDEDSEPTPESPLIPPSSPASVFTNLPQKEATSLSSGTLSRQESQTETANHSRSPTPTSTSTSTVTPTVTPTRTPSPTNSPTDTPAPSPPPEANFPAKPGLETEGGTKANLPSQTEITSDTNVVAEVASSKLSTNTVSESTTENQGIPLLFFFLILH